MIRFLILIVLLFNVLTVTGQNTNKLERPKLVVGIVVDQMRWDYLYRYYDRFREDGFKKLMKDGYNCQNTFINYVPSYTGPGHASIYTGSVPALHGIVANDWYVGGSRDGIYCVQDETVKSVGGSDKFGKFSPRNMLASTVGDELKIATKGRSKLFGIGIKDRGSILPAGHTADAAFWFDDSTGNFITSSFYMKQLPEWLNEFNDKHLPDTFLSRVWKPLYPLNTYVNSTSDTTKYETYLPQEKSPTFPHKAEYFHFKQKYNTLRYMPLGNTLTLKAAKACIKGEQMGADDITDFLCVTLSSTDYAGHQWGTDAVEIEDMYLRLDRSLASFFKYLDKYVGAGEYTVFLTADHGAANNRMYMKDMGFVDKSSGHNNIESDLEKAVWDRYGDVNSIRMVPRFANDQVYFNDAKIKELGVDRDSLKAFITTWLENLESTAIVVDLENIDKKPIPEPVRSMIANGYYKERCGVLQVINKPGWYTVYGDYGTTHGSWNPYDTHIPLLWYGWGINKGETYKTVHMTDIAPTVSALLHIQMPNASVGKTIEEVIKKDKL